MYSTPDSPNSQSKLPDSEFLRFETRNAVRVITLDRPSALHALNFSMVSDLGAAMRTFSHSDSARAIVLRGSPISSGKKAFCAGGDVVRNTRCDFKAVFYCSRAVQRTWKDQGSVRISQTGIRHDSFNFDIPKAGHFISGRNRFWRWSGDFHPRSIQNRNGKHRLCHARNSNRILARRWCKFLPSPSRRRTRLLLGNECNPKQRPIRLVSVNNYSL